MTDDTSTTDSGPYYARALLLGRLVARHGLDSNEALAAVIAAERHEDSPHTQLVRSEALAITAELFEPLARSLRDAMAGILPALRAAAEALAVAAAATREQFALAPPAPRQPSRTERRHGHARPAWQSPYGPPTHRH